MGGVEMASTGEVSCFGEDQHEAFLSALLSTGFKLPNRKRSILLSIASNKFRNEFAESAQILSDLGYRLYGTPGTSKFYKEKLGLELIETKKPDNDDDDGEGTALHEIKEGNIDMIVNISEDTTRRDEITSGYLIRRAAVDFDVSLVTNVKCAIQIADCLNRKLDQGMPVRHIKEYYKIPTVGWSA